VPAGSEQARLIVVPETSTVTETVSLILAGTRLLQAARRHDGLADCR
jgi:hypothetical protein